MGQSQPEASHEPITVEGLDHVFVDIIDSEHPQGIPAQNQGSPQEIPQGIPVEDAAKLLGTSPRAVIKRLQKGTLRGYKVPGKYGDKWLVDPQGIPAQNQGSPQEIPQGIPAQNQGVPLEIVQDLMRKVEALTYRNGYLEAQLAEKETQIKLLTDSQPKCGWWARFCSWMMSK